MIQNEKKALTVPSGLFVMLGIDIRATIMRNKILNDRLPRVDKVEELAPYIFVLELP
jgi:hypothetical protein